MTEDHPEHPYYDPPVREALDFHFFFNRFAELLASLARSYGYLR